MNHCKSLSLSRSVLNEMWKWSLSGAVLRWFQAHSKHIHTHSALISLYPIVCCNFAYTWAIDFFRMHSTNPFENAGTLICILNSTLDGLFGTIRFAFAFVQNNSSAFSIAALRISIWKMHFKKIRECLHSSWWWLVLAVAVAMAVSSNINIVSFANETTVIIVIIEVPTLRMIKGML